MYVSSKVGSMLERRRKGKGQGQIPKSKIKVKDHT